MKLRYLLILVAGLLAAQLDVAQWAPSPAQYQAGGAQPDPWPELLRWFASTVMGGGVVVALARGALRNEIGAAMAHHVERWHNHGGD